MCSFNFCLLCRPIRGSRGRGKYRGTQRNDLRNTLRNNNHVLTNVNREDETFKVTIPMSEKYDQLYLMTLLRENFADPNVAFYNVCTPWADFCTIFTTNTSFFLVSKGKVFLCFLRGWIWHGWDLEGFESKNIDTHRSTACHPYD